MFNNRNYMIFNVSEINLINFNEVMETSADTLRKSADESKSFVKWEGAEIPSSVAALTTKEGPYTHTQIINILNGLDWTPVDGEIK